MNVVDNSKVEQSKLCHARPGGVVRIFDSATPTGSEPFLVCVNALHPGKPGRLGQMHGLYDEGRPLFLVSLSTGEAVSMPNLSSKVQHVHKAKVVLGPDRRNDDEEAMLQRVLSRVLKDIPVGDAEAYSWTASLDPRTEAIRAAKKSLLHFGRYMFRTEVSPGVSKVTIRPANLQEQLEQEAKDRRMAHQQELDGLRLKLFEASEREEELQGQLAASEREEELQGQLAASENAGRMLSGQLAEAKDSLTGAGRQAERAREHVRLVCVELKNLQMSLDIFPMTEIRERMNGLHKTLWAGLPK